MPGDGLVQRLATSVFARVPTLVGRDQHEARFVLQVISLWPDLQDEERMWAFQRLNVYCIVAAFGLAGGDCSLRLHFGNHRLRLAAGSSPAAPGAATAA